MPPSTAILHQRAVFTGGVTLRPLAVGDTAQLTELVRVVAAHRLCRERFLLRGHLRRHRCRRRLSDVAPWNEATGG
ncbi:hypothetical protein [Pseudonocardia lacus]|uniref:hypothetical protein n=1 Tax=Pseudonocardia lacus TaxID=2835865 RepID=UPI001BDD1E52|nr:hypothetical protein [Pseudonocardia lacus]